MTSPVFSMVNLGCRVNRVECDRIAEELEHAGFMLGSQDEADVVIINTCAVTGEAEAKTRKAIRHAAHLANTPKVVVTGCVANLFADSLAAIDPSIIIVRDKASVARAAIEASGIALSGEPAERLAMPTPTGRTRPGIKVQDGCDLRCTYCIVWKARGKSSSVSFETVRAQVQAAIERGAREVVLTGINLGCYRDGSMGLPGLLDSLLEKTDVGRLRISSIEPQDVDENLIELMGASGGRIAPYLHMCLQSGSDSVLKRMGRIYSASDFAARANAAYDRIPNLAIETDLIVGFPGETNDEFEESFAFCERMGFSHIHTFRYSKRPGTPAAAMEDQIEPKVSAERSLRMRRLSAKMRSACAASLIGHEDLVVTQEAGLGVTGGLFTAALDAPVPADELVRVRITGADDEGTLKAVVL